MYVFLHAYIHTYIHVRGSYYMYMYPLTKLLFTCNLHAVQLNQLCPADTVLFIFLRQFLELGQILEGSRSPHRRTCCRTLFEPVRPSDTEITFSHSTVFVDLPAYLEQKNVLEQNFESRLPRVFQNMFRNMCDTCFCVQIRVEKETETHKMG